MTVSPLDDALERAERALLRIERSASPPNGVGGARDEALRAKVAAVVSELDDLIHSAGSRG